ncbi:MAG: hypothetical protein ACOCWY_04165 [Thermodesulfobacteriota bacterium]
MAFPAETVIMATFLSSRTSVKVLSDVGFVLEFQKKRRVTPIRSGIKWKVETDTIDEEMEENGALRFFVFLTSVIRLR